MLNVFSQRVTASVSPDAINALDYYRPTDAGFDLAINRAIDAAAAKGGGLVVVPNQGGVYTLAGPVLLKSNVYLDLCWSTLKLGNGVNTSVIESDTYQTLVGQQSNNGGLSNWGIDRFTLDGNRANNSSPGATSGHGLAVYGRDGYIGRGRIKQCARRGMHTKYATGATGISPFNMSVDRVSIDTTGEEGWVNEASDLHVIGGINIRSPSQSAHNAFDAIRLGTSGGIRAGRINVWRAGSAANAHRYALNLEGGASTIDTAHLETGATANLRLGSGASAINSVYSYNLHDDATAHIVVESNMNIVSDVILDGGGVNAQGVVIGGASAAGSNTIEGRATGIPQVVLNLLNSGNGNRVVIDYYSASGLALTGTIQARDRIFLLPYNSGDPVFQGGRASGAIQLGSGAAATAGNSIAIGNNVSAGGTSAVAIGNEISAANSYSFCSGTRSRSNNQAERCHASGMFAVTGDSQILEHHLKAATTDATPTTLRGVTGTDWLVPSNSNLAGTLTITGRRTDGVAGTCMVEFVFAVSRGAGAASFDATAAKTTRIALAGADVALTVDGSGNLVPTVTGIAAPMRWTARFDGTLTKW